MKQPKQVKASAFAREHVLSALCIAGIAAYATPLVVSGAETKAASSSRLSRPALSGAAETSTVQSSKAGAASQGAQSMTADQQIAHMLNRVTFGARPGDIEAPLPSQRK